MATRRRNNILITGAGGFLGNALATHLAQKKVNLFLTARKKILAPDRAKVFYGDLEDPKFCKKILTGIDTVFYTAGFKKNIAVHTSLPFEALSGNVLPLATFLRAAKDSNVRKLVYVSSTIVEYMSAKNEKIDGYVWGKFINEMLVEAFAKETGVDVKIIRSAPLYGPGDNFDPKTANFIPSFIKRVMESEESVVIWGSGKRKLQFIYIDDLVRNMVAAGKSPLNFFVFGNPELVSVNDAARKILSISGRTLKIEHDLKKPDKETTLSKFDNLCVPEVDITTGLKRTVQYYRAHHV